MSDFNCRTTSSEACPIPKTASLPSSLCLAGHFPKQTMNVFSDTFSFFSASIDSLGQEYGQSQSQSFCDDKDCTGEFLNMKPSKQDDEDDFPLAKCNSLLQDIMGDDGNSALSANDLDDFTELMRAPLETASTQDTFSGLVKAPVQTAPSRLPEEKALASMKSADIPPVFRIPMVSQPPTSFQVPKRPTLTVPSLAKAAGCGSLVHSGGCERSFEAREVETDLADRVAPVTSAFTLVPPLTCAPLPSPDAADRARQVACKQQRLYARQKLDSKDMQWKEAAATAKVSSKAKHPKRQKVAKNRCIWTPASQL